MDDRQIPRLPRARGTFVRYRGFLALHGTQAPAPSGGLQLRQLARAMASARGSRAGGITGGSRGEGPKIPGRRLAPIG